jgi:hypothetical protein
MANIFFSYSHVDEALRDELEKHLTILKRQGFIDTWHDRRIVAGSELGQEIKQNLETADVILLLVSSDFLASDYCYDIEMQRAMERHHAKEAHVIPIILRPCDWHDAPFGELLATPPDGKPVTRFPTLDDAFVEVVAAVKGALNQMGATRKMQVEQPVNVVSIEPSPEVVNAARSSNLRIKKEFTDREKDLFLKQSFDFIANFFESSLTELQARNTSLETDFSRIDARSFDSAAYVNGKREARGSIWYGGENRYFGDIAFAFDESRRGVNEAVSVDDDGYSLYLKAFGMQLSGQMKDTHLTQEGAAEFFWDLFIAQLQR